MSNGSAKSSLPSGWVQTTVREVFTVVGGGTPSTSVAGYWNGGIPWITSADIGGIREIMPRKTISEDGVRHSATNVVPAHAIIVVTRVGLGKVGLTDRPLAFSQDCQGLISDPTLVDPGFAAYQLLERVQTFKYESRGTTISGVTKKQVLDLPFHLAPYAEQRRIVGAIEEQFSRIDGGVEALQRARRNLERLRAAIVEAAVQGVLVSNEHDAAVAGGRTFEGVENLLEQIVGGSWERHIASEETGLAPLPKGWVWVRFEALLREPLRNGHSGKASTNGSGVRTLTLTAVTRGDFSERNTKLTVADPRKVAGLWLQPGDILIERSNTPELVGIARLYRGPKNFAIFPDLMIRARIKFPVSEAFVELVLQSSRSRSYFRSVAQGIAGTMPKIDQTAVERLWIPLPPLEEQHRIVQAVEHHLTIADKLEPVMSSSLRRAQTLGRAVLSTAFAGSLVPQDSSDEPASALLTRIRGARTVEKSASQPPRRRSRR